MNIEMFLNSRMDEIFTGLLQTNAEYALTYRRYEHLCELTDPVVCQRKDIEISGEECESFALGVQRAIWFFGAETPQSGVILVAGREPICLVCLAAGAFLLPKNSAGPAGGQKSGLARPQDEGGLISHRGRERSQRLFWLLAGISPFTHRGHGTRRAAKRARIHLPEGVLSAGVSRLHHAP